MKHFAALITVLTCVWIATIPNSASAKPTRSPLLPSNAIPLAVIPFHFRDIPSSSGHEATIQINKQSFEVLFDSGSPASIIDPNTLNALGLVCHSKKIIYLNKVGDQPMTVLQPFTLGDHLLGNHLLGGHLFTDQRVFRIKPMGLNPRNTFPPINWGQDFLSQFGVLYDFSKSTISLFSPSTLTAEARSQLGFSEKFSASISAPKQADHNYWHIEINKVLQDGTKTDPVNSMLDTGGSALLIQPSDADVLKLPPGGEPGKIYLLSEILPVRIQFDAGFQAGSISIPAQETDIALQDFGQGSIGPVSILSINQLGSKVLIDFPHGKLYVAGSPQK